MTPKWTIRKYAVSSLGNEVALPWMLFKPGVSPPKTFHEAYWESCAMGETFSEALAYVESRIRKARIVEVELPKVERSKVIDHEDLGHNRRILIKSRGTGLLVRTVSGEVSIHNKNLKPLAEHLLALHYEKENQ